MRRQSSWERKFKLYCPLFRTPLAWWPNFYGFSYFGTQIIGGCRRHTVTSTAMTVLNQLGYELYSNCSAHCTRTSTLPLIWIRFADENEHYHWQAIASYHGSTMPTSIGNEYDWYGVAPPLQCTQCSKLLGMTFSLRRNSDRYHSTGIPASSIILFADENNLHGLKPLAA